MNPWIIILLVLAAVVFGLDYLIRRKKWTANSKAEKISLLVQMPCVGVYVFLSALGLLWGIASGSPQTAFGELLCDATLVLSGTFFVVSIAVIIASFILRKKERAKASIWINVIALAYMVLVLAINYLAGEIL
jgi:hypothetical protein